MGGGFIGPKGGGGGGGVGYPGKLTRSVLISCVLGAMGGLIFGYDIGISGEFMNTCVFDCFIVPILYNIHACECE